MTSLTDLESFIQEHDRCGELDGGVEEVRPGDGVCGSRVHVATIARSADED